MFFGAKKKQKAARRQEIKEAKEYLKDLVEMDKPLLSTRHLERIIGWAKYIEQEDFVWTKADQKLALRLEAEKIRLLKEIYKKQKAK